MPARPPVKYYDLGLSFFLKIFSSFPTKEQLLLALNKLVVFLANELSINPLLVLSKTDLTLVNFLLLCAVDLEFADYLFGGSSFDCRLSLFKSVYSGGKAVCYC